MTPPQLSIPPDYKSGISLRDFCLAIASGRPGWMRFSFGHAREVTEHYLQVPSFSSYRHGVLTPPGDGEQDLLVSTVEPHLTLGVFPSPQGGMLAVTAIAAVVPLSLSARSATSAGPGVGAFSMGSAFQGAAPEDQVRRAVAALVDQQAHLVVHAGDRICGIWRLSCPVSESEGRLLSAAVAHRVPGAQLVHDGRVHSSEPLATYGIPSAPPLTYPVPRPQPACRIVPRSEFRAWGVVSETVEPESLR